jgi:hypothetical protein
MREFVVTPSQFFAPVRMLENLVYQEDLATGCVEFCGKFSNPFPLEIEVVHVNVKTITMGCIEIFFGIL